MSDIYTRHGGPVAGGNAPLDGWYWKWYEIEENVQAAAVAPHGTIDAEALHAAREGRSFVRWVDETTPGAALLVLNDVTLVYNIPINSRLIVTRYWFQVETANDDCEFWFGMTDAVNGGGTFTPIGPHDHIYTAGAVSRIPHHITLVPPHNCSYAAGSRSTTFQVIANDGACEVNCGFAGWIEPEW